MLEKKGKKDEDYRYHNSCDLYFFERVFRKYFEHC